MAEKKFYVDINLLQNELKNGVIHKVDTVATLPTGAKAGQIAYVAGTVKLVHVFDGTAWKPIGDVPQFTGDVINTGLDMQIQAGKVSATELASNAVTTVKVGNAQITNAKLANMAAGTVKANITGAPAEPKDITKANFVTWLGIAPHQATNLSEGTASATTVKIDSSTGSSATLAAASTTRAGVMTKAMFDKLEAAAITTLSVAMAAGDATVNVNGETAKIKIVDSTNAGLMITTDKTKLDGIAAGAQVNVATNLANARTDSDNTITSSTGTDAVLEAVDPSHAGLMTPDMLTKLNNASALSYTLSGATKTATTNTITLTGGGGTSTAVINSAVTGSAGLLSSADKAVLDKLSALQPFVSKVGKVVYTELALITGGKLAGIDWVDDSADFGLSDGSQDTANSELVPTKTSVRRYVQNVLDGIGEFRGSYDAGTDIPKLDVIADQITDIVKGDYWIVAVAGNFFTKAVAIGDRIIANVNSGAGAGAGGKLELADFTVVKPSFNHASEAEFGLVELATPAEALAGTMHESAAITPKTLKYVLDSGTSTNKKSGTFGNGTLTSFTFPHTFGTGVTVQLFDNTGVQIEAQVTITANNVKAEFNVAPASGFRYVIIG